MKIIKCLLCLIIFLAAFAAGCFIFAPRDEAGKLALAYLRLIASRQDHYVTYEEFSCNGVFNPSYRITGLGVEGPMAKITFSDARATVYPLLSLMSRSARMRLQFGETTGVLAIVNISLSLESGETDISANRNLISVTNANVEGDIQLSGDITFDAAVIAAALSGDITLDAAARAITESTATVRVVPPLINAMFGTQSAARFVEPVSPGEWRIKKNARR